MRLTVDFSGLEKALESIGGQKAEIGPLRDRRVIKSPIELKLIEQGSIVISGAELVEQLTFPSGLLAIGNTQITLHIEKYKLEEEWLRQVPARWGAKYHFTDCKTIERMKAEGKFERYVTSNKKDGLFAVKPYDKASSQYLKAIESAILPCQNCLELLNYNGFAGLPRAARLEAVEKFSVATFFKENKSIFRCLPLYAQDPLSGGNYTNDWDKISREVRVAANWCCSCCGVQCDGHTDLLHVHHKDGNRPNNRRSNLEVVCLACHKTRPFHGHMYYSSIQKTKLENLRVSQKRPRSCEKCEN
jgi:hypothetical protein